MADELKVGDRVTSPAWAGETAVIERIFDHCGYPTAVLDVGGYWRLSGLQKVADEANLEATPCRP